MENNSVYIISGPTAVGKTQIAIALAKLIDGEIVNCDSVQLYKSLDIGSAKPSAEEMASCPHHLFSLVDPDYNMTVATYKKLATATINDILKRGKTPIVVGGTGLYLNSIMYDMDFAGKIDDGSRRKELEEMAEKMGSQYMHTYLSGIDPESAERIHPNNLRKVIRAIEAFELGDGIKDLKDCKPNNDYTFIFIALNMDRERLYDRINRRVDVLIQKGLCEEVKQLMDRGYNLDNPSMRSIGYKELVDYYNGECTLEEAVEDIKKDSRHYAKRQITWLKRYDNCKWIYIKEGDTTVDVLKKIVDAYL